MPFFKKNKPCPKRENLPPESLLAPALEMKIILDTRAKIHLQINQNLRLGHLAAGAAIFSLWQSHSSELSADKAQLVALQHGLAQTIESLSSQFPCPEPEQPPVCRIRTINRLSDGLQSGSK